jgi:hypothetical protein
MWRLFKEKYAEFYKMSRNLASGGEFDYFQSARPPNRL